MCGLMAGRSGGPRVTALCEIRALNSLDLSSPGTSLSRRFTQTRKKSMEALAYSIFLSMPYSPPCACSNVLQASEEVSKCLVSMKEILYGSNDKEPHTETVAQLAQELYNSGLLISLVDNLQVIDFEVRSKETRREEKPATNRW